MFCRSEEASTLSTCRPRHRVYAPAMSQTHVHECEACRIVDAMDGEVDGKLFSPGHWRVADERKRFAAARQLEDKFADKITNFAGSLNFVYLHLVWFVIWIADNIGVFGSGRKFDEFPFGLLTMIVSLEAIFLSTFVMVSQNRQAKRSEMRAQIDFESNLQSLIWSVHIGQALGIDIEHVEELCAEAVKAANMNDDGA